MKYLAELLLFVLFALRISVTSAQNEGKPLDLPVALPPGPSTWMLGQPYGNTVGAFNNGGAWYSAGQRLHFGIDLSMPCGTPLVAVADGVVMFVDDRGFGSMPHNLILRHEEAGLTTLYGHLLSRPPVEPGQRVSRGDIVAYSGDPDETCVSRPHLHFEVRSLDYLTAYNPVEYVNAAWHSLSLIGPFSSQIFQRDLDNARQWLTLADQPAVAFGGRPLNDYAAAWPPPDDPPANTALPRDAGPLAAETRWVQRRLGEQGCCFWPWWHPTDGRVLYGMDGAPGQRATIYEWLIGEQNAVTALGQAPPSFVSPDGTHELRMIDHRVAIRRLSDGFEWMVDTGGAAPALNHDNTKLMWLARATDLPGGERPPVEVWVSDANGENAAVVVSQRGGYAVWLDATRILTVSQRDQESTLSVYDLSDGSLLTIGSWERLRGLSVAPGGRRIMFYLAFHRDEPINGIYTLRLEPDAAPMKMPWFGAWHWRDGDSVYFIPFDPTSNTHRLGYYHIPTGEFRLLTDESMTFTVANGDWSVSADGQRIAYLNATDLTTWLLEPASPGD